jgi:hypothetical protein
VGFLQSVFPCSEMPTTQSSAAPYLAYLVAYVFVFVASSCAFLSSSSFSVAIPNTVTTFSSTELTASGQVLPREKGPIQPEVWPTKEEFHSVKNRVQYDPEKLYFAVCESVI